MARTGVRDLELPIDSSGLEPTRTTTYSMVGFTWVGAELSVRVRTLTDGRWQGWQAVPELDDGPDAMSAESEPALMATQPLWVGPSEGIEVEVRGGSAQSLTMTLIDPGPDPVTAPAARQQLRQTSTESAPTSAPRPEIRSREDWGADPSWRSGTPSWNATIKQVHVHHTATGSDYERAEVPALIRGMYRYHTATLGWSDIGYNFLIDRFGRTWLGRAGGAGRLVRGAHTLGFNHASTGISVIGNYETTPVTEAAKSALVLLAAWKLDRYERQPAGQTSITSSGSDRYANGSTVTLPVLDGHRDTNDTACPGQLLYERLPGIRTRTQARVDRFS